MLRYCTTSLIDRCTLRRLHNELCYLGVHHTDLRYDNVLQTTIRRGVSPKHKEVYQYRIIDLEDAYVSGIWERRLREHAESDLVEIVNTVIVKVYIGL